MADNNHSCTTTNRESKLRKHNTDHVFPGKQSFKMILILLKNAVKEKKVYLHKKMVYLQNTQLEMENALSNGC
jgi:hypothetical protein